VDQPAQEMGKAGEATCVQIVRRTVIMLLRPSAVAIGTQKLLLLPVGKSEPWLVAQDVNYLQDVVTACS
jgi:hypothetical protein